MFLEEISAQGSLDVSVEGYIWGGKIDKTVEVPGYGTVSGRLAAGVSAEGTQALALSGKRTLDYCADTDCLEAGVSVIWPFRLGVTGELMFCRKTYLSSTESCAGGSLNVSSLHASFSGGVNYNRCVDPTITSSIGLNEIIYKAGLDIGPIILEFEHVIYSGG